MFKIEDIDGMDARTDFYRVFLPRFELIRSHLAPELDCRGFEFEDDIISVHHVIFHSCKEGTFFEVLRAIAVMQHYGWLDIDLLGGVGHHYSSFQFIIKVLKLGEYAFDTTSTDLICKQSNFVMDLYSNYRKFHYVGE